MIGKVASFWNIFVSLRYYLTAREIFRQHPKVDPAGRGG